MTIKKHVSKKVEFDADGTKIVGQFFVPANENEKHPTIVMAHGFASVKEMHINRFAEAFAESGFAVLLFDYRHFGESEGSPRQEINPWQQIDDYRHAITFATTLEEVDSERIGVWGTSFSGGHAIVLGATDKRVKCVVSQVPTISGHENAIRRGQAEKQEKLMQQFASDRIHRLHGGEPATVQIVPLDAHKGAVFHADDAIEWYANAGENAPNWKNYVTLRSLENTRSYEPGHYIELVSPTPLLLLVAERDYITPTDLSLKAYEKALEPKKLVLLNGGHFEPYVSGFERAATEAIDWFLNNL